MHIRTPCFAADRDPVSDEEDEEGGSEEASEGEDGEDRQQPRKKTKAAAAAAPRAKPRKKATAGGEKKLGGFQQPVRCVAGMGRMSADGLGSARARGDALLISS